MFPVNHGIYAQVADKAEINYLGDYIGSGYNTANPKTSSTSVNLTLPADSDRHVFVGLVSGSQDPIYSISGVEVGGVSATPVSTYTASNVAGGWYYVNLPTGTSVDIVVTSNGVYWSDPWNWLALVWECSHVPSNLSATWDTTDWSVSHTPSNFSTNDGHLMHVLRDESLGVNATGLTITSSPSGINQVKTDSGKLQLVGADGLFWPNTGTVTISATSSASPFRPQNGVLSFTT